MKSGAGQLSKAAQREFEGNKFLIKYFEAAVDAIGDLPKTRQRSLAETMLLARNKFRTRKMVERQKYPRPSGQRRELNAIKKTATHLLKLMGVNDPSAIAIDLPQHVMNVSPVTSSRLLPELQRVASERRPNTEVGAIQRLLTLLLSLSDLAKAAENCKEATRATSRSGRGGARREGPTAEADLLNELFDAFMAIQPEGRRAEKIKLDTVLKSFVKAGLAMVVANAGTKDQEGSIHLSFYADYMDSKLPERTTEDAFRTAFSRWQKSQTNAKTQLICS